MKGDRVSYLPREMTAWKKICPGGTDVTWKRKRDRHVHVLTGRKDGHPDGERSVLRKKGGKKKA